MDKYAISRLGRKLPVSDDVTRILVMLPKDVPERMWLELFQTEEVELICLDLREEILEAVNSIIYKNYIEQQSAKFTVHCTETALLQIINWNFLSHDPGEEASAAPACFIPRRAVSWVPDPIAPPSRMDNMMKSTLPTDGICPELFEFVPAYAPAEEVDMPVIKPIPEQYWFPGKVNLKTTYVTQNGEMRCHVMSEDPDHKRPDVELVQQDGEWQFVETIPSLSTFTVSQKNVADIEVLEKVTEYTDQSVSTTEKPRHSALKLNTPVDSHLQGAGDSTTVDVQAESHKNRRKSHLVKTRSQKSIADIEVVERVTEYPDQSVPTTEESRHSSPKQNTTVDGQLQGAGDSTVDVEAENHKKRCKPHLLAKAQSGFRSRLPPTMVHSESIVSGISDCRIRNLRMETQYEISSEKNMSIKEKQNKNRKNK